MGSTFASLHVKPATQDDASRDELTRRIRAALSARGLGEVAHEPCDRDVVVAVSGPGGWIRVTDSAFAPGDIRSLDDVGRAVTQNGFATAVGVSVYDDDVLDLALYVEGGARARLSSWPGYFSAAPRPALPAVDDVNAWEASAPGLRALFADPVAWRSPNAEDVLRRVAAIIGVAPPLDDSVADGGERLCFADARTQPPGAAPRFDHAGGTQRIRVRVGASENVSIIAHNVGGSSTGLIATVWGPALERGLIVAGDAAVLRIGPPFQGETTSAPLAAAPASGRKVRTVTFDAAAFPGGPASPADAFRSRGARAGYDAWLRGRVEVAVTLTGRVCGNDALHLGLAPLANGDARQASWTIDVEVVP